ALATLAGCRQKDGDPLTRAGRAVGSRLGALAGGPGGKGPLAVGAGRGAVGKAAVDGGGAARLAWERILAGAAGGANRGNAGGVVLSGRVGDAKQKALALELARRTLGVEEVVDELAVRPDEDE